MTVYYADAYDPALTALRLASIPADSKADHSTVVPARCSGCHRIWAKPATASGNLCRSHGPSTCPACHEATTQGALW